jgi:hypothetical protein
VERERWGAEHWERLAEGQLFDGMESWLPWLVDDEVVVGDLLGADGLVLLIDPAQVSVSPLADRLLVLRVAGTDRVWGQTGLDQIRVAQLLPVPAA